MRVNVALDYRGASDKKKTKKKKRFLVRGIPYSGHSYFLQHYKTGSGLGKRLAIG